MKIQCSPFALESHAGDADVVDQHAEGPVCSGVAWPVAPDRQVEQDVEGLVEGLAGGAVGVCGGPLGGGGAGGGGGCRGSRAGVEGQVKRQKEGSVGHRGGPELMRLYIGWSGSCGGGAAPGQGRRHALSQSSLGTVTG